MERKGICKNVGVCSMANKVQIINDDDAEFVCPECGEPLQPYVEEKVEVNPGGKKKLKNLIMLIIAAVVVIGGIIGAIFGLSGGSEKPKADVDTTKVDTVKEEPVEIDTPKVVVEHDTVVVRETVVNTVEVEKPQRPTSNTLRLGYATYTGGVKAGKPDGQGLMKFSTSHIIDSRDPKAREAEAGDYVDGSWKNGHLIQGYLYSRDGNVKEFINIGM